jgi:hypothetical protein
MKRILCAVMVLSCLVWPLQARGDLVFLPKWHMSGDEACYDQDGARLLLMNDALLVQCDQQTKEYRLTTQELHLEIDSLQQALTASKTSVALLQANNAKLSTDFETCTRTLGTCQAGQPMATYWWIVVVATALVVGMGAGIAIDRKALPK